MVPALLVLDLDETLVFATETPLSRDADFCVGPFHLYTRPHAAEFIAAVAQWFRLAVWTSSSSAYALPVVDRLFPSSLRLEFVWTHEHCTRRLDIETRDYYSLKNLRRVKQRGYPLERVLVLDDSPEKLQRHYGNHLRVKPFLGDEADTELRDLLPYLDWIRERENFRCIEKRHWRLHASG